MLRALRRRQTLAGQAGFGLIEVVVSAALLLIVAGAILTAIDRAEATSGRLAAEGIAGNIAQQDHERLRALRITELGNLYQTRTVAVKGIDYTVVSTGSFVSDATQAPGCTSTASANHIRITSSVRSRIMRAPVMLTSFVNPSIGAYSDSTGGLAVKVVGATGTGVPGIDVTISNGTSTLSQPTSTEGCAFFAFVPVGAYTVSYSVAGYVSQDLVQTVSFPATVAQGTVLSYQKSYDRAFTIQAVSGTRVGTTVTNGTGMEALTVGHSLLPGSGVKTYIAATPPAASIATDAPGLFPHASPAFEVYSGGCSANKLPAALVSALPTGYTASLVAAPAQAYAPRVFEPAFNLTVRAGSPLTPVSGARVVMTEAQPPAAGCTGRIVQTTIAGGTLPDPGVPYSTWRLCAQAVVGGVTRSVTLTTNQTNDQIAGRTVSIDIPTTAPASTCA